LPPYSLAGKASFIAFVIIRFYQGLAASGDVTAVLVIATSPFGINRGYWSAVVTSIIYSGTTAAFTVAAASFYVLDDTQMLHWGWRIPFLLSGLVGFVLIYYELSTRDDEAMRGRKNETNEAIPPVYKSVKFESGDSSKITPGSTQTDAETPDTTYNPNILWKDLSLKTVSPAIISGIWGVTYYTCFVWAACMFEDHFSLPIVYLLMAAFNLALNLCLPLGGMLGDLLGDNSYTGVRIVMQAATLVVLCSAIPIFMLFSIGTASSVTLGFIPAVISLSVFGSNLPVYILHQYSTMQRHVGVQLVLNYMNMFFSGSTPLVQTVLTVIFVHHQKVYTESKWLSALCDLLLHDYRMRPAYIVILAAFAALLAFPAEETIEPAPQKASASASASPPAEVTGNNDGEETP
jgi:MFS family permease